MLKISLIIISLALLSCGSVEQSMQKELDKIHIGMTETEFKSVIKGAVLESVDEEFKVYRLNKRYAKFGDPNHYSYATRFFLFENDKLSKIDVGVRATDYRIQIDKD